MKDRKILICRLIGLMITALLLSSCESNQLTACQQEKLELQKIMDDQQAEIDRLRFSQNALTQLLEQTSAKLRKCQDQLAKLKKQKTTAEKTIDLAPPNMEERLAELKKIREAKARRMKEKAKAEKSENN